MRYKINILFIIPILSLIIFFESCKKNTPNEPVIKNKTETFLKIISPNGGEKYKVDSTITLKWEFNQVDSINFFFSSDGGKSWDNNIINRTISSQLKELNISSLNFVSDSCLFKIQNSIDSNIFDISDSLFSVLSNDSIVVVDTNQFDLSYLEYLQFNKGNIWIYNVSIPDDYGNLITHREKYVFEEIYKTDNQKKYYKISVFKKDGEIQYKYYVIDFSNGYFYEKFNNFERLETELDLQHGEHIIENWNGIPYRWINVSETSTELFGKTISVLQHKISNDEVFWSYKFSKELGIIEYSNVNFNGSIYKEIVGALIDSVLFGDTTVVTFNPNLQYLSYYPLSVGNKWDFKYIETQNEDTIKSSYFHRFIERDTLINGLMYFKIKSTIDDSTYILNEYERVDRANAFIYRYDFSNNLDVLVDKLNPPTYSTYHDTYRFYNDNITNVDVTLESRSQSSTHSYYLSVFYDSVSCVSESYYYSIKRNIGLSHVLKFGCNKNIYIDLESYEIVK